MSAVPQPLGRWSDAIDDRWWREALIEDRSVQEVLACQDVGAIFRFLRGTGWSLTAICGATGLSETRIRAVMRGAQRITSYEVLERVALGLRIPRGAMGLAYTDTSDSMLQGSDTGIQGDS
ncbi:MAG: hypothetical protein QOE61_2685 [Micromonosporaceae bacterium]|jgi:hypothetical protein|nr:hypothetical protein [Micromonosporaceae bacterium]